jgi:hypothetical protein
MATASAWRHFGLARSPSQAATPDLWDRGPNDPPAVR